MTEGKLLIVEDDPDAGTSLMRALRVSLDGVQCFLATTPELGIKTFEEHQPEVVLLDLHLEAKRGIESGFELLKSF